MQKMNNFKFLPEESIRVWRTFGIGREKVMSKDELNKKYYIVTSPLLTNEFPQGSTQSNFYDSRT